MRPQILSWLRNTRNLTVRYILVGFAFVPAGLLYARLAQIGRASVMSMSLCLALGFVMANVVWKWSALKQASDALPVVSQALAAALAGPAAQHWAVAVSIAEVQERVRLFAQATTSRSEQQRVVSPLWSYEASNQRVSQANFTHRAGVAHAAFSGVPS